MEIVEIIPPYLYSVKTICNSRSGKDISQNRKMQQKMSLSMLQPWNDISISLPRMQIMVKRQTLSPTFIPWMVSMSMSGD